MPAVISRQNPDRFTPAARQDEDRPPVYLIAPLSWREKAEWQSDLVLAGASRWPSDLAVIDAVRLAVLDVQPDNEAELLSAIDEFRDAVVAQEAGAGQVPVALREAYGAVEARLRGHPGVALLLSERIMFALLAPPLCAARALVGWENVPLTFERRGGKVPDALIGCIPADDLTAIGGRALALMRVSDEEKKASDSPSLSPDDPKISPLHPIPEKHGPSSERNTRRTRAN
jgi:hypothetical protein